ncbi:MAG TPA: C4-dicarboxylate ABC transporter [Firmicutes bacterium]|nr:C4-dicarboxylate ABC transporter [Bacillota bacterium]
MFIHAGIILGVMVVVFVAATLLKVSIELSMLIAAVAGAIAHGVAFPARHVVEGAFTYFDVTLIFITATLFMNLLKEAGGVSYIVRAIISRFYRNRVVLLLLLTFILLVPGALTGAGSVTVLIVGAMVGNVLTYMGISKDRVAAIVFLCAAMSAAAPPINLWAMMTAAGSNMPYVGFTLPLAVITILGALFAMFYLGWKGTPISVERALAELPEPPKGMNGFKVAAPFVIFLGLVLAGRVFPFAMPVIGLPLAFLISAGVTVLLSPKRLPIFKISCETVENLLPLIGTLTVVGILVQSMALTGARGLISLSVVTMPILVIFATLFLVLPISEGVLQYGAAPLLGVPLIFLFNMKGLDPIIALAGMATIWPLGDALPPTTLVGRAAVMTVGYDGPYYQGFLKRCIVPALFIAALGTVYVVFSNALSFLVAG